MKPKYYGPPKLSRTEAAKLLGVTRQTLANWAERGIGPKFVQAAKGHTCYYEREVIEEWINENTHDPEKDGPVTD